MHCHKYYKGEPISILSLYGHIGDSLNMFEYVWICLNDVDGVGFTVLPQKTIRYMVISFGIGGLPLVMGGKRLDISGYIRIYQDQRDQRSPHVVDEKPQFLLSGL